mmetsp:Transcript_37538/g.109954  ORF Transcript_37538/g.109954 Transcript_37538/m.109954 type:complete len:190 (-) Transcript_37538:229-798(-)
MRLEYSFGIVSVRFCSSSSASPPSAAPAPPAPLPPGAAAVDGLVPSAVMLQRKVLPPHESYWCHVLASPVTSRDVTSGRGGGVHVLLLSSAALYVLLPEHTLPTLTLPMHHVERLEGAPQHHGPELPHDGSSMLAIFLYPAEAQRLGIPSCLQYSLASDASRLLTSMHEQNQHVLAASFVREPAWLLEV